MNIKIYHQDKVIFLAKEFNDSMVSGTGNFAVYQLEEADPEAINQVIFTEEKEIIIFLFHEPEQLKTAFWSNFLLIQAAGGVVENNEHAILLIYRRKFWDLPKGKLDEGESLEACAEREIEEETGVSGLTLTKFICCTYHTYIEKSVYILKETFWYHFKTLDTHQLLPQESEGIEQVQWISKPDLISYYEKSYPSITDILKLF